MEVKGLFTLLMLSMSSVDGSEGLVYIVDVVNVISWWKRRACLHCWCCQCHQLMEWKRRACSHCWCCQCCWDPVDSLARSFFFVQQETYVEKCNVMAWRGMDSDATPHPIPWLPSLPVVMYFRYLWPRYQARKRVCVCVWERERGQEHQWLIAIWWVV